MLSMLTLTLAGCGGASPPAAAPATPEPTPAASEPAPTTASVDDVEGACLGVMHRMRDCSAQFIPALVDLRIQYDRPSGIAAAAEAHGRDALVAEAFEEWKVDAADDRLAALCAEESRQIPVIQDLVDAGRGCLSEASCDDAVACVMPLMEAPWKESP
ncbi:MAG: hypothetical protein H6708_02450 [Kofleriaceae bacterium]|nr:hypothetical protein [Myxococcales bacterium]MCB9559253.1 hypothetical protein [Kofleriaceae bacterium]